MMGGQAVRRSGGWLVRCAGAILGAIALLIAYPPTRLPAQVGYPPDQSPYRDVKRGQTLILSGGYLIGDRGVVGVGPSDGPTVGARFQVLMGKDLAFFLAGTYGRLSRYVADPTKNAGSQISGPIKTDVGIVEGGMDVMLSGAKTWHGLAPYLGGSAGAIFANNPPVDSSGYEFGVQAIVGGEFGIRWYFGRQLAVRTDFRWQFWQVHYPLAYKQPAPDGSRILAIGADEKEWTDHPWFNFGVAWTF